MEPIAIVKKRSRIWLLMALLIIVMLLVAAALWFMGDVPTSDVAGLQHQVDSSSASGLGSFA